jgi:hypothetical protein
MLLNFTKRGLGFCDVPVGSLYFWSIMNTDRKTSSLVTHSKQRTFLVMVVLGENGA